MAILAMDLLIILSPPFFKPVTYTMIHILLVVKSRIEGLPLENLYRFVV